MDLPGNRAASLRAALPVESYLFLLHQAATSGFMPQLDRFGRMLPGSETSPENRVPVKERTQALQYLVNKVMADPKVVHESQVSPAELAVSPTAATAIDSHMLARIARGDVTDAVVIDPDPASDQFAPAPFDPEARE